LNDFFKDPSSKTIKTHAKLIREAQPYYFNPGYKPKETKFAKKGEQTMKSFKLEKKHGGNTSKRINVKKRAITLLVSFTEDMVPPPKTQKSTPKLLPRTTTMMIAPCITRSLYPINSITKIL
jgi:hypothetical protein